MFNVVSTVSDNYEVCSIWDYTLKERKHRHDLIELFRMYKTLSRVGIDEMFTTDENKKCNSGQCLKLRRTRCTKDIARLFFEYGGKQIKPSGSADSRCT